MSCDTSEYLVVKLFRKGKTVIREDLKDNMLLSKSRSLGWWWQPLIPLLRFVRNRIVITNCGNKKHDQQQQVSLPQQRGLKSLMLDKERVLDFNGKQLLPHQKVLHHLSLVSAYFPSFIYMHLSSLSQLLAII
ncbi:unnamed protein product [Sphenostylis stenocarpa]|uniref:Uncharacterized protein n=1 Tax=Sphenostylis stenocarpa TaxID=92480 RepID=A0AA86RU88_9FABA|nr:unnamed protein product [Sphenostylis stenocarpa]